MGGFGVILPGGFGVWGFVWGGFGVWLFAWLFSLVLDAIAAGCGVVDFCFLTLVDVGFGYAWITGF